MISVTFNYYVKCFQHYQEEIELQVANNKENRCVISRLREHPELKDSLWCTRHESAGFSETNRCSLKINEGTFTLGQMNRGRWKKVTSMRKEKTQIEITNETIF